MESNVGVTLQVVPLTVQSANGVTTQILALAPCTTTTQSSPTRTPTKILPKTQLPTDSPTNNNNNNTKSTANNNNPVKNDKQSLLGISPKSLLRCKRRIDFGKFGLPQTKPVSVSRRNERERNRVKLVNNGFDTLRRHIPVQDPKSQKISKVETLRLATEYIRHLQQVLEDQDAVNAVFANNMPPSPLSPTDSLSSTASYSSCGDDSVPDLSPEDEDLLDFNSWFN